MYNNHRDAPIPISEAAKTDERIAQLIDDIATGKQSMCAPFPGIHKPMENADKRLLEKALTKVRQRR